MSKEQLVNPSKSITDFLRGRQPAQPGVNVVQQWEPVVILIVTVLPITIICSVVIPWL
jgi:hypothetical protein